MSAELHALAIFAVLPLVTLLISRRYAILMSLPLACVYVTGYMMYHQSMSNEEYDPGFLVLLILANVVYGIGVTIATVVFEFSIRKFYNKKP